MIKKFEQFDSNDYYSELTEHEWEIFDHELSEYLDNSRNKPFFDFPLKEFMELKKRSIDKKALWFLTNNSKYNYGYSFNNINLGILWINNVKINDSHYYIKVWLRDDEWYWVEFNESFGGLSNFGSLWNYHYKCDQFEGLVQLLKDKGIIK